MVMNLGLVMTIMREFKSSVSLNLRSIIWTQIKLDSKFRSTGFIYVDPSDTNVYYTSIKVY